MSGHVASLVGAQSRPGVWKRLRHVALSVDSSADCREGLTISVMMGFFLLRSVNRIPPDTAVHEQMAT